MKALKDQLREWKKQSKQAKKKNKKNKKKRKGKLSTRDIEDLMRIRGPRYERRRGALRQK
ncbi:hypothetical protein [Bacillus cereus]|uniref:hypothetical protein n=1 Tax=Bacillus cereus TaxID=1396 RepID=UPI002221AE26|nr:hypothetical protein [Bacillus cereus]